MAWTSLTEQFPPDEIEQMERMTAEELIPNVLVCEPLVALRLLAEVMLNGDDDKLKALLTDEHVNEHWEKFSEDPGVDQRDFEYGTRLVRIRLGYKA